MLTIYVELPGVGTVKDKVQCSFTSESFDLKILDFNSRNFRLIKDNLEHDIIPAESKYIVKKDKVILKLKKVCTFQFKINVLNLSLFTLFFYLLNN